MPYTRRQQEKQVFEKKTIFMFITRPDLSGTDIIKVSINKRACQLNQRDELIN